MNTAQFHEVLKAYAAVWSEADPMRREALMTKSLSSDAEVMGPGFRFKGYQEISREVDRFLRHDPGARPVVASGIATHHNWARFAIAMLDADGKQVAQGEDIVELGADGRIVKVLTFWGALPPVPADWPPGLVAPDVRDA